MAVIECIAADPLHVAGVHDFRDVRAAFKCIVLDVDAVGYGDLAQVARNAVGPVREHVTETRVIITGRAHEGELQLFQRRAIPEYVRANVFDRCGDGEAAEAVTTVEGVLANADHGVGNRELSQIAAAREGIVADLGDGAIVNDLGEHPTVLETPALDVVAVGDRDLGQTRGNIVPEHIGE